MTAIVEPRSIGIDSATSRDELIWGALEGVCYQLRTMVETVEASGLPLRRLRLSGGGSRSDAWSQLRADVLGRPVETLVVSDAAALGAAMVAAVGAGAFSDWESATVSMVSVRRRFEPDAERASAYEDGYARFRRVDARMREVDRDSKQ